MDPADINCQDAIHSPRRAESAVVTGFTASLWTMTNPKNSRPDGVLGQIVLNSNSGYFQEATEPNPKRERVIACFG